MHNKLLVSQQDNIFFIPSEEILYLQSDNCYTSIYMKGGRMIFVCKSLARLSKELESKSFIRVNQSYLINKYHIEKIDKKKKSIGLLEDHNIHFTITLKTLLDLINQN